MANFNLTPTDIEDIGVILNISHSILDNLYKLEKLELEGGKESKEYKSIIECLSSTLTLESSLYDRLGNDPLKLQAVLNNFTDISDAYSLESELKIASSRNREDLVKRRIILKLVSKITAYGKDVNAGENVEELYGLLSISEAAKVDFINTILTLLNLHLNDYKYMNISKDLLKLKYNLAFLYKFVENDFFANNFSINPTLYWTANLVADLNEIDYRAVRVSQQSFAAEIMDSNLEFLIEQSPYTLRNKDVFAKTVITQIFLRSGLLFSSEEIVQKLKERFQTFIGINKMMGSELSSEEMILETLEMYNRDRELPNIVSLRMDY